MTLGSTINWDRVHAKLAATERALQETLDTRSDRVRAMFRRRAAELARPEQAQGSAGDEVRLLIFRLGRELYGVELSELAEVLRYHGCTRVPGAPAKYPGVINLRGELRPVLDLTEALMGAPGGDSGFLLILRRLTGLRVDDVEDIRDCRLSDFARTTTSRCVRGMAPGAVMLLDLDALLSGVTRAKEEASQV